MAPVPLTVSTPSDREVAITRVFDAPRHLVFDAHRKPEFLRRWLLGPPGWVMEVCDVDFRVNGEFRFVWRDAQGTEMGMRGVHLEIVEPERIVSTQIFDDDWTGGVAHSTLVLTERDGRTTLVNTIRYSSKEARDAVLKTPMEHGMEAGYVRLDSLFASELAAAPSSHNR